MATKDTTPSSCPVCEGPLTITEHKNGTKTLECKVPYPDPGKFSHTTTIIIRKD